MNSFKLLIASSLLTLSAGAPSKNGFIKSSVIGKPSNQSCRSYSYNRCDFDADALKGKAYLCRTCFYVGLIYVGLAVVLALCERKKLILPQTCHNK